MGTIDPLLRSVSFYQGERPLARLYYYTTHPMSYYGDGRVSADFVGLARQQTGRGGAGDAGICTSPGAQGISRPGSTMMGRMRTGGYWRAGYTRQWWRRIRWDGAA